MQTKVLVFFLKRTISLPYAIFTPLLHAQDVPLMNFNLTQMAYLDVNNKPKQIATMHKNI